ncbi:serine hydrolase domain-containing protein [Tellurirhabdus rosea]|uniref:serine hydrolase domain-containing protein n=1 Tax=Tellurirhabdus rosea TaxID=2674997 RepID=UPI0022514962|nr:serine hydrolase domain-containing protein [Tellurirhabdus rosea]
MHLIRPLVLAVLLLVAMPATVWSQTGSFVLRPGTPEATSFNAERLQRIDRAVNEYVQKGWLPGAVALIVRNGRIVYHKGFGYDDISRKSPLAKDAIFRIASQTKAITSVAVMMLYEEGKFRLDDPVSQYIPEFKGLKVLDKFNDRDSTYTTVAAKKAVTIRHLLSHTSGIGYPVIGSPTANALYAKAGLHAGLGVPNGKLVDQMKILAQQPLLHQPGERWTYGLNTDLLGYLVEVVSGMPLDQFFRTRIFDPLGMKDTWFYLPPDRRNRLSTLYTEEAGKGVRKMSEVRKDMDVNYPNTKGTYFSGGAGLSSTALDYATFLQMLLNGGTYNGKQLLSRATVRMMTSNQIGALSLGDQKFGLGFGIFTAESAAQTPVSEGSFQWGGYFGTSYWADPREGIVALFLTQMVPNSHGEIGDKFKTLVYQALASETTTVVSQK